MIRGMELVTVKRLTADQTFHKSVQSAFLTGLAGASGIAERPWRLVRSGRGRVDLAVEVDGDERMLLVIEIKGTDWDAIPADRVMRNLRRHLRQRLAGLSRYRHRRHGGRTMGEHSWAPCCTQPARPTPRRWRRLRRLQASRPYR